MIRSILLITLFLSLPNLASFDAGYGSDGACSYTVNTKLNQAEFNCTSLSIDNGLTVSVNTSV
jgi:hypothetical protein